MDRTGKSFSLRRGDAVSREPVYRKTFRRAARGMYAHGRCLWNSFVLVARLSNLLALMIRTLPELYDLFAELSGTLGTEFESERSRGIYQAIAPVDSATAC